MSQWDVVSSGDADSDVLGSERDGQPRGPRRAVALSTVVALICAFAVGGWWGGGLWQRRQAASDASHVATVTFALLSGSIANANDPGQQEASWTAILVNTGPATVRVDSATWGGEAMPSATQLTIAPHASHIVVFTSTFACAVDGTTSSLPLPPAVLRLRSADGTVFERTVPVLNPVVWSSSVFQACGQVAANVENSVFPSGDETVRLVGKVLTVHVVLVNQGPIESGTNTVTVAGDGFVATSSPAAVTKLAPGATAPVDIHVQVSDCAVASSGQIQGIVLTPTGEFGADATLVRAMDRLVQATCPPSP